MQFSLRTLFIAFTVITVASGILGAAYRQEMLRRELAAMPKFRLQRPAWLPNDRYELDRLVERERKSFLERTAKSGLPEVAVLMAEAQRQKKLVSQYVEVGFDGGPPRYHSDRPDWLPESLDIWQVERARWFGVNRSVESKLPAITNFPNVEAASIAAIATSGYLVEELNDLSHLDRMRNLKFLYIYVGQVGDLQPLSQLNNLESLHITGLKRPDLSPIRGLTKLRVVLLNGEHISDLSAFSELINLEELYFCSTGLRDISGLSTLANLKHLELASDALHDVSALASCTSLRHLDLNNTPVSSEAVEKLRKQLPRCKIVYR